MVSMDKTWLFVPAQERYVKNLEQIKADAIILDLEDSLNEQKKDEGLRLAAEVLQEYGKKRTIFVRLNTGHRQEEELSFLRSCIFAGYMLPKMEDTCGLEKYQDYMKGKEVIALIESAKGILHIADIAGHPLVHRLAFGGEDYCASLGYAVGEEATLYARSQVVLYAAYYQKYSLDTISLEIQNMELFLESYKKSRRLGFSSKLLIHPRQVNAVRDCGKTVDIAHLKHILKVYRDSGEGIVRIGGEIYEKPHITRIEAYLGKLEEQ